MKMMPYIALMRLQKPIGIFLLLWPTLWGLWLASSHFPSLKLIFIFVLGVIVMRSAGCVVNDMADRNVDCFVERTKHRPITSGQISVRQALMLLSMLLLCGFGLVLLLNSLTIRLSLVGAGLALVYPFLKRVTHLPQLGLGLAFAWGVPMSFAATLNVIPKQAWIVYAAAVIWPIVYDTQYAMVDRVDDESVGIKSTAILFGHYDRLFIGLLQILFLVLLAIVGNQFHLQKVYFISLLFVIFFFIYQQRLIYHRIREQCFKAFLNNQWVGLIIFVGILFGKTA